MSTMSNLAFQPLYDKIGATYDATRRAEPEILNVLAELLDLKATADVLDIQASNEKATVVADLSKPGSLPVGRFDCVLITQTLQYVRSPDTALENLWQALAPGGSALITVPCTSRVDPDALDADRWRFTPLGLETLLRRNGEWAELEVYGFGSVLTSAAFLMGFAAEDLRDREVDEQDEFFPLVACARARKAS